MPNRETHTGKGGHIPLANASKNSSSLAQLLIQDELFDLTLYQKLYSMLHCEKPREGAEHVCEILTDLIPVEKKHLAFWQDFFERKSERLDTGKKFKLVFIIALSRVFGKNFIGLVLEAIEIYGIKKYLLLWETHENERLAHAVSEVLGDELAHESDIILKLSANID